MASLWLQFPLVLALGIAAWITGMDATADPVESSLLWTATAFASAPLLFRLLPFARSRDG